MIPTIIKNENQVAVLVHKISFPYGVTLVALTSLSDMTPVNPAPHKTRTMRVTKKNKIGFNKILLVLAKKSAVASSTAIAMWIDFLKQHKRRLNKMNISNATTPKMM